MIKLVDVATGAPIGTVTEEQLQDLIDVLEEESSEDRDYYIDRTTVELLEEHGADAALIRLLRQALGDREEMDVRWEPA